MNTKPHHEAILAAVEENKQKVLTEFLEWLKPKNIKLMRYRPGGWNYDEFLTEGTFIIKETDNQLVSDFLQLPPASMESEAGK